MCCTQGTTPVSGLPAADVAVLEERALKMRKAMGENLADDVAGESVDSKQRRLNLIRFKIRTNPHTGTPLTRLMLLNFKWCCLCLAV